MYFLWLPAKNLGASTNHIFTLTKRKFRYTKRICISLKHLCTSTKRITTCTKHKTVSTKHIVAQTYRQFTLTDYLTARHCLKEHPYNPLKGIILC
jgi:hypothetical protein